MPACYKGLLSLVEVFTWVMVLPGPKRLSARTDRLNKQLSPIKISLKWLYCAITFLLFLLNMHMFTFADFSLNHGASPIQLIIKTCCVLHNLMRIRYPTVQNTLVDKEDRSGNQVDGAWRLGSNMEDTLNVQGHNASNREGKKVRNTIKHWCRSPVGSVPWQDRMIWRTLL